MLASKLVQVEPTLSTFHEDRSWLKVLAPLNMSAMVVTELVSQLPMSPLKLAASLNMPLISVTPLVHDLASSASLEAALSSNRRCRSRFMYVTPLTTPVSPRVAMGQRTVTPLVEMANPMQLSGRDGFGSVHAPAFASKSAAGGTDPEDVPRGQVLVEGCGTFEHRLHVHHLRRVPLADVLIEGCGT